MIFDINGPDYLQIDTVREIRSSIFRNIERNAFKYYFPSVVSEEATCLEDEEVDLLLKIFGEKKFDVGERYNKTIRQEFLNLEYD